jgi:hypothetical protein
MRYGRGGRAAPPAKGDPARANLNKGHWRQRHVPLPQSPLFGRADANGHQRGVRSRPRGTARGAPFAEELRLIAGRPAIGRHQHFIILALHGAARHAVRFDDPDAWRGRTSLALRTGWAGRPSRPCRTGRSGITFGPLRTRRTGIALRTLAASGQGPRHGHEECHRNCQMRCTHFQNLPNILSKSAPIPRQYKIKLDPRARTMQDAMSCGTVVPTIGLCCLAWAAVDRDGPPR